MALGTRSATPSSYYYSGQGRLLIGERDTDTGANSKIIHVGNVTELTISISNSKKEHKESMTGLRGVDNVLIQDVKASIKFKSESVSIANLGIGLYGTGGSSAGATVTSEIHEFVALGNIIPLLHPLVTSVVVKAGADATAAVTGTTCVLGTDYTIDTDFGTIYPMSTSAVITAGKFLSVAYTYGTTQRMDALAVAVPPERFIRFEGLNTLNSDMCLVEVYRVKLEPISNYSLISDDFAAVDFAGSILQDTLRPVTSQYFSQRNFTPS